METTIDITKPYWNMEIETKLNTPEIWEYQNKTFLANIQRGYDQYPLTKKRMDDAGVNPSDIKSLDDLEKIPIYGQPQMRELLQETGFSINKVLKMALGDSANDIYLMAATSGTTGIPTPYPITRERLPEWREIYCRMLWRCGVRPGDKIVLAFGLSMFLAWVNLW